MESWVKEVVVANFATTAGDGKTYQVDYYNLDVIISIGYRVKSLRGTQFRQWATGRYYPSSKTCGNCGYVYDALSLSERDWVCPRCHEHLDRDVNAARNILSEGMRVLNNPTSAGTVDYTGGDSVRPVTTGCCQRSRKPKSL